MLWGGGVERVHDEGYEAGKSVRVDDATRVEIAVESILVLCAWIIGDLDAICVSCRVVVDV